MAFAWIASRLRLLVGSERGMALPTALFAMVASVGLASAAVIATVDVQQGSKRDSGSKSAIAAADAGANVATMRLNRDAAELETAPCLEGATPEAGWCPPVTGTVGGAEYSYQVSEAGAGCGEFTLCVAVTGTAGEVTRRVLVSFNQGPGAPGGGSGGEGGSSEEGGEGEGGGTPPEGVIGQDSITLSGNADIRVSIGTNGNLVSSGNANVCGNIRHGIGKEWSHSGNASQCNGYEVIEENSTLPSVSSFMPSDIETNNSNARITTCKSGLPVGCQSDTYNGKWTSTSPFNPSTRRISLSGNTSLTFGGGDYWLCSMTLSGNSELIMAAGAQVRFFFDTPEHCGTGNQISFSGNTKISATGYQPGEGQFNVPGFFLMGSPTTSSSVSISGNASTSEFVIYGPDTGISLSGNGVTYKGLVAGKTIAISGNGATFDQDEGFELPPYLNPWFKEKTEPGSEGGEGEPGAPSVFTPQFYVECSGEATPTPDANC
jgi:hypothetical protein